MTASTRIRSAVALAALATAALVTGCGSSTDAPGDAGATSKTTSTTTVDTSEAATPPTSTTEAGESGGETTTTLSNEGVDTETSVLDTLADGDHYVYMAGLENGTVEGHAVQVVIVDPVEFLTGQAAIDAAAEDGTTLDTDYYIRNSEQTVKRIAVVPDASVTTLDGGTASTVAASVDEVWRQPHVFKINVGNVRGVTTISSIEAVYLP